MDKSIYRLTEIMSIIKPDKTLSESALKRALQRKRKAFNEPIDKQIERDFLDDIGVEESNLLKNVSIEVRTMRIKRYQAIVKEIKSKRDFKCQICGQTFEKEKGEFYCEAHHIVFLSQDGSQNEGNVVILCANHHRMFHYAKKEIVEALMKKVLSVK